MRSFLRSAILNLCFISTLALSSFVEPAEAFVAWRQTSSPIDTSITSAGLSPDQALARCLELAKQGDVESAFAAAVQANQLYRGQRLFTVSYIDTLLTIVEQHDSKMKVKILNSLIGTVNELRQTGQYNGNQDPELAFRFMSSLSRLSNVTMSLSEKVSSKVRIYEGQIAKNLAFNPGYPQNALEALAGPMISMAQGYAIRDDKKMAFDTIRRAVDVGFGEFESLLDDPVINRLDDRAALEELIDELEPRYLAAVKRWSQTVVSQFQRYPLSFNLEDIDGDRVSNADFSGELIVMDIWATWCLPCRKAIPHYIELQKEMSDQGVSVLGVAMDDPANPDDVLPAIRDFVAEHNFNYRCALGTAGLSEQIPGKQALPTTVFIDRTGNVRYVARGYHDYAKIKAISEVIISESQAVGTNSGGYGF